MLKLPDIKLPFLKSNDAFAIDIGSSAIKIVYIKPSGSKSLLVKWAVIPLLDANAELSPEDRKNLLSARIGEFLAKEKLLVKNVISSVSGNQVIVRYVRFPKLSREELSKTIQFEAEPYIPFDIREVDLSFHIIGDATEDGQKKIDTILVAAKKEIVQSRLDILNDLNLRPVVMDIDVLALQNAYELNAGSEASETAMLINIGASVTNIAIVENRLSRVVRDIVISGNSFTKAIQRSLGCDLKAAEDLKLRYGLLVTEEEKERTLAENQKESLQISTALTPVAKDLLNEIQRSIDFYISHNTERVINRILLSGGSANLKNLDGFLHQELRIPVQIFNPLEKITGGDVVPAALASQLAVAVGLALRRENDVPKK